MSKLEFAIWKKGRLQDGRNWVWM